MKIILVTGAEKLIKRLNKIVADSERKLGFFKNVGKYFFQKTIKVFKAEGGYDQLKWKAFSSKTLRTPAGTWRIRHYTSHVPTPGTHPGFLKKGVRRYSSNSKLLQDTNTLRGSFHTLAVGNKFVRFGTDIEYSAAHQVGGGRLPARRMLWISQNDIANISKKWKFFERTA